MGARTLVGKTSKKAAGDIDLDDDGDDTGSDDTGTDDGDDTGSDDDGDDSDDSGDADDDGDDTDPETEFLAGLTPEQAKFYTESTGGLKARLTKANGNARKHRLARAALEKAKPGGGDGGPKPGPPKKDAPLDQAALLAQLRTEMTAEADAKELRVTAAQALVDAGLTLPTDKAARRTALGKAVKLLDLEGADADDVDNEVEALKAEMPGLFKARRPKPKGGAGGPARTNGAKSKLGTDLDALFD